MDGWQADGGWQRLAVNAGKSAWQNVVSCWLAKAEGWRWLAGGLWLAKAGKRLAGWLADGGLLMAGGWQRLVKSRRVVGWWLAGWLS